MPKKKKEIIEIKTDFTVNSLESLKLYIELGKPNPVERVMAMNLLMNDYKFVAQYKVVLPEGWVVNGRKYFIADFFIPELNLIIETDGKIHNNEENWEKDLYKNNIYTSLGFYIFRFTWDDVMGSNPDWDIFNLFHSFTDARDNQLLDLAIGVTHKRGEVSNGTKTND